MRRRDFLAGCGASAGALYASQLRSQGPQLRRAAIVIGIDKTGLLPPLNGAASGAKQVADWLHKEGFDVTLVMDDQKPVIHRDLYLAVQEIGKSGYDQLVVYFSGHGFLLCAGAEFWLLSEAPENPNEAISVKASIDSSKRAGFRNVIFISDACRSKAYSFNAALITGQNLFSNPNQASKLADVDALYATIPGDPAQEVAVDVATKNYEGIFTSSLLQAYRKPDRDMVALVDGVHVVPNRRLRKFLVREVGRKLSLKNRTLRQIPHCEVTSEDNVYIGKLLQPLTGLSSTPDSTPDKASLPDAVNDRLGALGVIPRPSTSFAQDDIQDVGVRTGLWEGIGRIRAAHRIISFETQSGCIVRGAKVKDLIATRNFSARVVARQDQAGETLIEIAPPRDGPPGSLTIVFEEGFATTIAALPGFVATITVEDARVADIRYVPSSNGPYWPPYERNRQLLDELHATLASSARLGGFRLLGNLEERRRAANQLASVIWRSEITDPTLTTYLAYAVADASLDGLLADLSGSLSGRIRVNLSDLVLLSRNPRQPALPFCPMMTQGWVLLASRQPDPGERIAQLRRFLRPALWTTFEPEALPVLYQNR